MIILTILNKNHKHMHYMKICIIKRNKYRNSILDNYNYYEEYKKFKDYYIEYVYVNNRLYRIEYYNYSGKYHREDGPAIIEYFNNGRISLEKYYLNGNLHKEDSPACIKYYENEKINYKEYCLNGKRHNENGPAYIKYNKNDLIQYKEYYLYDKKYSYDEYILYFIY